MTILTISILFKDEELRQFVEHYLERKQWFR